MYTVGDYLLDVVHALGTDKVFGVPGDYNLQFLDHITARSDMRWVGDANELNAAYITDGYARKNGFGALVTTFGVGELSALNGFAGSMAEHVPVLEIVGTPTTKVQKDHKLVHHTFGDGDFLKFEKAHRALGFAVYHLNVNNAIDEINKMARALIATRKPAYLTLPLDLADVPVDPEFAKQASEIANPAEGKTNDSLVQTVGANLKSAKHPVVLVGHEISRFNLANAVKSFIVNNNLPFTDNGLGKGVLSEGTPQFIGTYNGELTPAHTKEIVDQADLVLLLGAKITDSVSGGFTQSFTPADTISLTSTGPSIFGKDEGYAEDYDFSSVIKRLGQLKLDRHSHTEDHGEKPRPRPAGSDHKLNQKFYDQALEASLQPGQTLIAEQGTSYFGLTTQTLPKDGKYIGQPLWGSIGYTFPAMLGSQLADLTSRNVLSIGEGSLQMTIQEFGLAFREKLHPIILLIENDGYTVERYIHGMNETYNDVPLLDYDYLPQLFGAGENEALVLHAATQNELLAALDQAQDTTDKLVLVRVQMAKKDAPQVLAKMAQALIKQNS